VVADDTLAKTFGIAAGSPLLQQACSAFSEDGSVVFHEEVIRTGTVSFALSRQGRSPQH
jgi:GntR family transcriptional regulator